MIELRVTPGRRAPVSSGVTSLADVAGAIDEVEVHAAHLFDPAPLSGVEPHHLVAPLLGRLRLSDQAGCVVARTLGLAGAPWSGTHVLCRQPHRDTV